MQQRFIDCPLCTQSPPAKVPIDAVYCPKCKSNLIKIDISPVESFITYPQPGGAQSHTIRVELTNKSIRDLDIRFEPERIIPTIDPDPGQAWMIIPQGHSLLKGKKVPFIFTFYPDRIGRNTAEAIISVKVAGIPNVPKELIPPILFSVGPPPQAELTPDQQKLGTIYLGGRIETKTTLRNVGGGRLTFVGYGGTHIPAHTFSPPILIGANARSEYEITFPLETANLSPGPLTEQIRLRFDGGVPDLTFPIEGQLNPGPTLEGTVRWKQVTEEKRPLGRDQQQFEYLYNEKEQNVAISRDNYQIPIHLGDIPQGVRTSIELTLTNNGTEALEGTMSFINGVKGIVATFGGLRESSWKTAVEASGGGSYNVIEIDTSQGVESDEIYSLKAKLDYKTDYNLPQLSLDISFKLVPCQEYPNYVAADFGTTNSCIAYLPWRRIKPEPVKIDNLTRYGHMVSAGPGNQTPGYGFNPHLYSFCCFEVGGDLNSPWVGYIAERAAIRSYENAKRSVRSIKTHLGTEWCKFIDGVPFKAQDIAAFIVKELVQKALDEVKMRPARAIITMPANSSPKKINETLAIYQKAGLKSLTKEDIIYEPEAAAYYYILTHPELHQNLPDGTPCYLLTFDFGGGTLDVSVVRVKKEGEKIYIAVLASRAKSIGGDTIDWALRKKVVQKTTKIPFHSQEKKEWYTKRFSELTSELSSLGGERGRFMIRRLDLLVECEQAKIELAMGNQPYNIRQVAYDVSLSPQDLEEALTGPNVLPTNLNSNIINEALGLIDEALALASQAVAEEDPKAEKITHDKINIVFMVGGASRIPLVQDKIKGKFGKDKVELATVEAKTCVALGAVLYATSRRRGDRYQFSKAHPKTEYRIGMIDEDFMFKEIFPPGAPFDNQPSKPETIRMPTGGECAFQFALNRGSRDRVSALGNPEIDPLGERVFRHAKAGDSFNVTYQLSDTGYVVANVEYPGGSETLQVPILDEIPEGKSDDDPGF